MCTLMNVENWELGKVKEDFMSSFTVFSQVYNFYYEFNEEFN